MGKVHIKRKKVRALPHWERQLLAIRKMREEEGSPVDGMGAHTLSDESLPRNLSDFHVLVASLLSSQSKDTVVFPAMERLKAHGLTVCNVLDTQTSVLASLIKPVGFYNRKALNLKRICGILREKYNGAIPTTVEGLMGLPGIGPKMTYLVLNIVTSKVHGICVDTHVHRISNRLQWVSTKVPEATRKELESWLPKEYWHDTNRLIVGFGQSICKARAPKCADCSLRNTCGYYCQRLRA